VIATDELVAFDLALAQQRPLMGTPALEGAPASAGANKRHVDPVRRHGKRTVADKVA
jgi:hypothetical protein